MLQLDTQCMLLFIHSMSKAAERAPSRTSVTSTDRQVQFCTFVTVFECDRLFGDAAIFFAQFLQFACHNIYNPRKKKHVNWVLLVCSSKVHMPIFLPVHCVYMLGMHLPLCYFIVRYFPPVAKMASLRIPRQVQSLKHPRNHQRSPRKTLRA